MAPLRVGHKGAAGLAEGNTLASFDAALAAGVDMIEFDVLSESPNGGGRLLLAHDYADLHARAPLELGHALEYLTSEPFAGLGLDVDLKLPGYSGRVAGALREAGVLERSVLSSMYGRDLEAVRELVPGLSLGLSVPKVRRDYAADARTALPAWAILMAYRRWLPGYAGRLRPGRALRCDHGALAGRHALPDRIRETLRRGPSTYGRSMSPS